MGESRIVLVGAGHAHLHVLREWPSRRDLTLTCISAFNTAAYSGLIPAALAGQVSPDAPLIPLGPLCRFAGARLIVDNVSAIDVRGRRVHLTTGEAVPFDVLSLNVGSMPRMSDVPCAPDAQPIQIKPMQTFLDRLRDRLRRVRFQGARATIRIVIVGGGAGAVEVALCLRTFVASVLGADRPVEQTLVSSTLRVPSGTPSMSRRVHRALDRGGIVVHVGRRAIAVDADRVRLDNRSELAADVVIWATDAAPVPLLDTVDLPKDPDGFLQTDDMMASTEDRAVFAAGDAGSPAGRVQPKAGVYPVRQGRPLLHNLLQASADRPLEAFVPQRDFLRLLNTGDGRAIGAWRGLSFEGRWCWWLKKRIDERFVARYRVAAGP